jgi:hypothetical protein
MVIYPYFIGISPVCETVVRRNDCRHGPNQFSEFAFMIARPRKRGSVFHNYFTIACALHFSRAARSCSLKTTSATQSNRAFHTLDKDGFDKDGN